jgi:8-oxo-dGTP pyrophosphatase MutT (NUDIX family)
MEIGESIEQTAVRETLEETGVRVQPLELLGIYTGAPHTFANGDVVYSVVTVLVAEPVFANNSFASTDESRGIGWFDLDQLPANVFEPHRAMLSDVLAGRRGTWT